MKRKLYIETSVWNQLEHDDRPDWKEEAIAFFSTIQKDIYDIYISESVLREINQCEDVELKERLIKNIKKYKPTVLPLTEEVLELAEKYLDTIFAGKDKRNVRSDAEHVAFATVYAIHYLISFNYKHLLVIENMEAFNGVNLTNGYSNLVEITTPRPFIKSGD